MCALATELERSCRVCLAPGRVALSSEGRRRLAVCTGRRPSRQHGLPSRLCRPCARRLPLVARFLATCRRTEQRLRRLMRPNLKSLNCEADVADPTPDDYDADLQRPDTNTKTEEETYENQTELRPVVEQNDKSKRSIQCDTCGLVLNCLSAMNVHMRSHSQIKPYKCPSCDKSFGYKGTMIAHMRRFHSDAGKSFVCDFCGKQFFRKKDVTVHIRRHTGETPYSCSFCAKSFSQQATLTRHIRTHTGEKPYPCKICGRRFAGQSMLKMHHLVHTDERKFTCDICGKAVKSKDALSKHSALHSNVKSNVCDKCGMAFAAKGNLNLHIKNVHSQNSGRCVICNKEFSNLKNHMRKHTGETPFSCDICGRSFAQKGSLSIHMSKHESAGKYSCVVERCRETFPMKSMMEFHVLKYHSNQTPYACTECDRSFYRNSDLSRHKKYHQNGKSGIV